MGHSDERTHEGYTHPIPGTESQIREALSAAFQSPPGSTLGTGRLSPLIFESGRWESNPRDQLEGWGSTIELCPRAAPRRRRSSVPGVAAPSTGAAHPHGFVTAAGLALLYAAGIRVFPRRAGGCSASAPAWRSSSSRGCRRWRRSQPRPALRHLIQNIAIAEWAPALLVLGIPPALGAFIARSGSPVRDIPAGRPRHLLGTYIAGTCLGLRRGARHPRSLLHLEHLCYLAAGVVLWWPVFQDAPQRLSSGAKALYLAAAFFFASPLGLALSLLGRPIYAFYEHRRGSGGSTRSATRGSPGDNGRRGGDPLLRARRLLRRAVLPGGGIDRRSQFAEVSSPRPLHPDPGHPSVPLAPSTERE